MVGGKRTAFGAEKVVTSRAAYCTWDGPVVRRPEAVEALKGTTGRGE